MGVLVESHLGSAEIAQVVGFQRGLNVIQHRFSKRRVPLVVFIHSFVEFADQEVRFRLIRRAIVVTASIKQVGVIFRELGPSYKVRVTWTQYFL